ncbi:MAG: hypothetical protein RLZZ60_1056 [Bacteroidota bacterium]|jgi:type I restriction enzyme S subunit
MELMQGYKQTELGIIPTDWEILKLGELFEFKNGLNKEKKYFGHGTPIINYMDVFRSRGIYSEQLLGKVFLSRSEINAYGAKKGDIFFTRTSETVNEIGISSVLLDESIDTVFSGFVLRGREKFVRLNNDYKKYCFSEPNVRSQIVSTASYTTRALTNGRLLSQVLIKIPPLPEQTAIANALSDIDALISQTEMLIEKKKAIKQGAMQELLKPKDGWVTKKLGEIIHLQGGYAFKSEQFTEVGVPIIRISDVGNNEVKTENSVCYKEFNIPPEFVARKGDTLIAMSGATTGKVGVYNHSKIAYINQRVGKFIVINKNSTSNEFISHIVRSEKFKDNLSKQIAQGAQPNISGKQIESIEMSIPNNYQTQVIIASILSDIDKSIAFLELKLNKLKQQKQGMMQTLLTGKIRLVS